MIKKLSLFKSWLLLLVLMVGSSAAWADEKTDVLTANDFAATSTQYKDFSGVTKTSDAVYAGNSAKNNLGNIQLRTTNSNSGIITTTSGGKLKSVKVVFSEANTTERSLDIYGSNTAYSAATDLYNSSKQGTKIGSVKTEANKSVTRTLNISDDYSYIGLRSNNGAIYIESIEITWETGGSSSTPSISADNVDIAYNATSGAITYTVNNGVTGGSLTAATTDTWLTLGTVGTTVPFTTTSNTTAAARTATVTLTYTYNTNQTVTKDVTVTQAGNPNVINNISDITAAGTYAVKGTIVAKSQRGFIVGDGTGYVYYYNQNYTQADYNIGDKVKLSGSVVAYGGVFEFNASTTVTAATESNYVAEDPTVLSGADMDSRVASTTPAQLSTYVQYEGTLSVSSTYYNITNIDGATTAKGSISFPRNTDFTSLNGKQVKVKGYYVGISSSQYYNTMIGSVEEVVSTEPSITASDVELEYDATSGEIAYTIDNPATGVSLNATTTADWISNIAITNDKVTFTTTTNDGDADRSATITLSYQGATDKEVTVTQKHQTIDYATLPFSFDGGRADIEGTNGLTQEGLGTDYNAAPYLKFDGTGDYVLLHFNERPGTLTFDVKGNTFSDGTFTVQTSEDGVTYTNLKAYTELGATQSESFDNLGENVRYIKWVYTEKVNGNVALGNITLAKYSDTPTSTTITAGTLTNVAINELWDGDLNDINLGDNVAAGTTVYVSFTVDNGYTLSSVSVQDENNTEVTVTENTGNYSFTMPNSSVTINATATQNTISTTGEFVFVKVTSAADLTEGDYLIVYEDGNLAFDGSRANDNDANKLDATNNTISISVNNGKIYSDLSSIFTISPTTDGYTIKSASGFYIGQTSDANGLASNETTAYENTISFEDDGSANIVSGGAYLRYNAASNQDRFRYYKASSYTGQKAIQLYKLLTEKVTISSAGYATYCSEYALDFSSVSGLTAYEATISGSTVTFVDVNDANAGAADKLFAAGEGMLLQGAEGTYTIPVIASAAENTNNKFVGTVTGEQNVPAGIFVLMNQNNKVGFYKTTNPFNVGAHTAYLPALPGSSSARDYIWFGDDNTTGIEQMEDGRWKMEDSVYDLQGRRVNQPTKGMYIVNGKKVVLK